MPRRGDDYGVRSVAAAISTGVHVDWDSRHDEVAGADSAVRRELRVLEQIARFHRRVAEADVTEHRVSEVPFGRAVPVSAELNAWGHFTIHEPLGTGAFGVVYRATDRKLERDVALKLLWASSLESLVDPTRMLVEARLLARVRHVNVVTIHGADEIDDRVGIWMEFIKGQTLESLLGVNGLFGAREAAVIGLDLCRALAAVHRAGLVHSDVKAHNVMREQGGRTVLMDFGVSKDLQVQAGAEAVGVRDVAGTPLYLAPEVLRGAPRTAEADLYSLGVLLFHLVTGSYPVAGQTCAEIERAHERGERTVLRDVRPDLPSEFVGIVERAIAADRPRRFATAGIFEAALADFVNLAEGRHNARGIGSTERPSVAVLSFETPGASDDVLWLARGIPSMLVTGLAQIPGLDVVSGERIDEIVKGLSRHSVSDMDGKQLEVARRAGADATVVGSVFKSGGVVRIDVRVQDASTGRVLSGHTVHGTDVFLLADDLIGQIHSGLRVAGPVPAHGVAQVTSSNLDAYRLYIDGVEAFKQSRRADSRRLLEQAVRLDPTFAAAFYYLAYVSDLVADRAAAVDYRRRLADHVDRLPERLRLLWDADEAQHRGDFRKAAEVLETLIARFPDEEDAYLTLASLDRRNPERMLVTMARGVRALPDCGRLRNQYGYVFLNLGRYADAIREFETYARFNPTEPNAVDSVGDVYLVTGEPQKALECQTRALELDPTFTRAYVGKAHVYEMLGRYDEALDELGKQYLALTRSGRPATSNLEQTAYVLSRVGRYREAEERLKESARLAREFQSWRDVVLASLARAFLALERRQYSRVLHWLQGAEDPSLPLSADQRIDATFVGSSIAGIAEARAGRINRARARLDQLRTLTDNRTPYENWYYRMLEGEIALTTGDFELAGTVFAAAEPEFKYGWAFNGQEVFGLRALHFDDRVARLKVARSDFPGAIAVYRQLLSPMDVRTRTRMSLEPRYVLELARLLDRAGQHRTAREEYQRFVALWSQADPGLPELEEARRAVGRC